MIRLGFWVKDVVGVGEGLIVEPTVTCQRRRVVYISAGAGRVRLVGGCQGGRGAIDCSGRMTVRGLCF